MGLNNLVAQDEDNQNFRKVGCKRYKEKIEDFKERSNQKDRQYNGQK